jgi:hypothetical protein
MKGPLYFLSVVIGIMFIVVYFILPTDLFIGSTLFEKMVLKDSVLVLLLITLFGFLILARIENIKELIKKN